jgi:hypothetical protein
LAGDLKPGRTKRYQMARILTEPAAKSGHLWRFDRDESDVWRKNPGPLNRDRQGK